MSEVLAQLEKKGGGGEINNIYLAQCGASGQAIGGAVIPIELIEKFTSFTPTKIEGTGTLQRLEFNFYSSSMQNLGGINPSLNNVATIPTIPNNAAYVRMAAVMSGSSFAGGTFKFTFS